MTLFSDVVGQPRAVAELQAAVAAPVHAYLLVGPPGSGTLEAARSFAAALLCASGGCDACDTCRRVLSGVHPDFVLVERVGASILIDQAKEIVRLANRSPTEGSRKVLVLTDFHLVEEAAPVMLKTIEEPPASTIFLITAEAVPPELVTIASRCVQVTFGPVPEADIAGALVAEGLSSDEAAVLASAAAGRMDRARLLASDPGFADRRRLWASIPARLDGTGHLVATLVDELEAAVEGVLQPLKERQAGEVESWEAGVKARGERVTATARRDLEDRHKREQRRVRTDELRFGLATLASVYRDRAGGGSSDVAAQLAAVDAILGVNEALIRNPNEVLLLQGLLVRLSALAVGRPLLARPVATGAAARRS